MNFDTYFKLTSYAVVVCGALALFASGGVSLVVLTIFAALTVAAWLVENSRRQISERFGLVLIVLVLPLYYLDWQYQLNAMSRERAGAATLAHLILGLAVIKLFQTKGDRDWIFLYLISFFQVLLAAGLSISPTFLGTLALYLLCAVSTVAAFEIRKARRGVVLLEQSENDLRRNTPIGRLTTAAVGVLVLITLIAVPMFFVMPRTGGAGLGGRSGGLSGFVGFSDKMKLGDIGRLQQSNEIVMRVRLDNAGAAAGGDLRWRGVALDSFDNVEWFRKAQTDKREVKADEKGLVRFETIENRRNLLVQTVYLEPLDTPVLFGAKDIAAVQGGFARLSRDSDAAISLPPRFAPERAVYKVFSDTSQPDAAILRGDNGDYPMSAAKYLEFPKMDERIGKLAAQIIKEANAKNRYDKARAIERYLQTNYGYTLDLKAEGDEPVADFLFRVKEGHCEYFSSALAVMLRTQGIATRVVNGFQHGEYNDAADAFIVSQKDAHSWVEVYFPETNSWVTFDPTPAAGRDLGAKDAESGNFVNVNFNKYLAAAEMFWMQYVVAYDNQEQRSLARSFRDGAAQTEAQARTFWQIARERFAEWWNNVAGENGAAARWQSIGKTALLIIALIALVLLLRLFGKRVNWRQVLARLKFGKLDEKRRVVEFYERMIAALNKKGLRRASSQTPLEFAFTINQPEAVKITEAYNRVRFGAENLAHNEAREIENWLLQIEAK